jgi:hypothetical protein
MKKKRGITIRFGPLGLSLLAAGITAVGVAAVSFAASGDGGSGTGTGSASNGSGNETFQMPAPGGGVGAVTLGGPNLSAEDRQKLEDFRSCMESNGAPGPPDPGKFDPSDGPPKPPSAADREKLQKAFEACKSKLPEDLQKAGPPMLHRGFKCGSPPGAPPGEGRERGLNQNQSNQSGTPSSGSTA